MEDRRIVYCEESGRDRVTVSVSGSVTHDLLDGIEAWIARRRARMDAPTKPEKPPVDPSTLECAKTA